jgi:hypothetical protein
MAKTKAQLNIHDPEVATDRELREELDYAVFNAFDGDREGVMLRLNRITEMLNDVLKDPKKYRAEYEARLKGKA